MRRSTLIIGLRITAILSIITLMPLLWMAMLRLPWQIDCAIAASAALAFAYKFERGESQ